MGGEGVQYPTIFVKLVFEIAVDRQTSTQDQTFEGSRTATSDNGGNGEQFSWEFMTFIRKFHHFPHENF